MSKTNTPRDTFDMGLGKLPPQAVEIEERILGSALISSDATDQLLELLKQDDFYREVNQRVYGAIATLAGGGSPVDMLTVSQQLRKTGELDQVGGNAYLTHLTLNTYPSSIEYHAAIVKEMAVKRRLITVGSKLIKEGYEETTDAFELLSYSEQQIHAISSFLNPIADLSFETLLTQRLKEHQLINAGGGITGHPSSFRELNRYTTYEPGRLYIIAARPAMGKSLFKSNEITGLLYRGKSVATFDYEMTNAQNIDRMLAASTGIPHEEIKTGRYHRDPELIKRVMRKQSDLSTLTLYAYDSVTITLSNIASKCRKLKASKKGLHAVFIDYLQIMPFEVRKGDRGNKNEQIGDITKGLKMLAKELDIAVILLSQLSRDVEKRGGTKKPILSDLRDSGNIEQDSDCIMFLYRPHYYGINHDSKGLSTENLLQVIVAKNRDGHLGVANLMYHPAMSLISDFPMSQQLDIEIGF